MLILELGRFRGNTEYAQTNTGRNVQLRDSKGLTARGEQFYRDPEITIEVPATQTGRNREGDARTIRNSEL